MNVLSLFDGMSCGRIALERAGIKVNKYFASEIDKHAIKVTQHNFPDTIQLGDVTQVKGEDLPQIDLLIGGFPCQSFSVAGKQLNFDDPRGKLFFEVVRLLEETKPKYFLLENVFMKKEYQYVISKYLGVEPILINSSLVSAQNRKRLYWTNIPNITQPEDKGILLKDIMLSLNDSRLELKRPSEKRMAYVQRKVDNGWLKQIYKDENTEKSDCLLASMYKQLQEFIWKDETNNLRFFSPLECEILQTVPIGYTEFGIDEKGIVKKTSNTQRYKMLGNGWTVSAVSHIFSYLPKEYFEINV